MGMLMSVMGKGVPSVSTLTDTLYGQFVKKDVKEFDDFHIAVLDIFSTVNAALPGKHYDVPPLDVVESFYDRWKSRKEEEKKDLFVKFMTSNISLSTLDDVTIMLGVAAPPAAMAMKRAGESIPQLNMIKVIPDVIFVPTATLITLISLKLSRRAAQRKQISDAYEEGKK
ncbi:hypothetical protein C5167_032295 [Papaver somniferum]|uniref:Calcium ion-binding protein n=1 Tax=Papaver somniferum TaxID=3469 RepID=A0A4Y7K8J6_PAPSO|nr:uncharacterized protein LOC113297158 [Papaver somniferum]RZC69136.1 hypothetical protein C5167_032295 [Papaver somniferum]